MKIVTKSLYGRERRRKQRRRTTNVKPINLIIHVCVISALRRGRLTTTNSVLSIDVVRRGRNETTRGAATLVGHVEVAAARSCSCVLVLPARTTAFSERDGAVSNGTELYILAERCSVHRECVEAKPHEGAVDRFRVRFILTRRSRYGQTCTNVRRTWCKTLLWGIEGERVRQGGDRKGGREGRGEGDGKGCRCAVGGRFRGLTRAAGAMSAFPSALRLTCCCCCCWLLLICLVVFLIPAPCTSDTPRQVVRRTRERPGGDDDAFVHSNYHDDTDVYDDEENGDNGENWFDKNITAGEYY